MLRYICLIFVCYLLLLTVSPVQGAGLYQRSLATWQEQAVHIHGREFKFLIDPAKVQTAHPAFEEIWHKIKSIAAKQGITITIKEPTPFAPRTTVKTFFDTKDMALARKGYLIRLTVNYAEGIPTSPQHVVIKSISPDFATALAADLTAVKSTGTISAEENISVDTTGQLSGYVEKGVHLAMTAANFDNMRLTDFGAYVPTLLTLGLSPHTPLISHKAYVVRCRPGFLHLPGLEKPATIAMECWSRTANGLPVVYDISWTYTGDYAAMSVVHQAAEKLLLAVYAELNTTLGFDTKAQQYAGSKVRLFFEE